MAKNKFKETVENLAEAEHHSSVEESYNNDKSEDVIVEEREAGEAKNPNATTDENIHDLEEDTKIKVQNTDNSGNSEDAKVEVSDDENSEDSGIENKTQLGENEIEIPEISLEESEKLKNKKKTFRKRFWITVSSIVGILVCIYFIGVWYYSSHFFFGTYMQGFNCSNMTIDEAKTNITELVGSYKFTLKERNNQTEAINGSDIDLTVTGVDGISENKAKQNPFLWITDYENRKFPVNISLTMNEEKLTQAVSKLACVEESNKNMVGATALVVYQADNTYSVPDDTSLNFVSEKKILNTAKAGIYGLYTDMNLESEGCYVSRALEDKMNQALYIMNSCVKSKVTYENGDTPSILDGTIIHDWVTMGEDYSIIINDKKITEYVNTLTTIYNSIGSTRYFTSSSGGPASVSGGDYGWVVDVSGEVAALTEIIKSGGQESRIPVYKKTAAVHGNPDFGNTYVEVSISAQHLWLYVDGSLVVSTDVVTGNPLAGNGTHTGVYYVKYKERNATLKGQGYASPVSYWMPFNGGEGLHDASWRGVFGGSIYRGGGSHGCVNIPPSAAATIFNNITAGTPVVVY